MTLPLDHVLGIECYHHYGVTTHAVVPDEETKDTVYRLTRAWHPIRESNSINVLDDNHTWEDCPATEPKYRSRIRLIKNEKTPYFLMRPNWVDDGPGATWFTQEYRLATIGMILEEINSRHRFYVQFKEKAEQQRDTIRGRKTRSHLNSVSNDQLREARLIARRWEDMLTVFWVDFEAEIKASWPELLDALQPDLIKAA